MIISPPFLPVSAGVADDIWLNTAMTSPNNEGAYPVTSGLAWHGGMHLVSPSLPVRAIADGTVAYVRPATVRNQDENHPLNYQAAAHVSGWTSDGCVIVRHDTDIGEGANSNVRYFSIYMHLETIPATIVKDAAIYRKDVLGQAGYVNGQTNRIHLEIICDDVNLLKLVGRNSGNNILTANGRIDAVYGDAYFQLPVGTVIYAPKSATERSIPASIPVAVHTTDVELFVGIRYAGHGFVSTYQADGVQVGTTLQEDDFEYNLYKKAMDLHTQCPSAAFELLRFGRVLGPDVLAPADTPHWRQVCYPGGQGLVNLAPAIIHKFSDADFPHWRGWTLVDDTADLDSRMDAPAIRAWLDTDHNGTVTPDEARSQLATVAVQAKLKGVICKTPSEWNAATIDARWGWLKTVTEEHPEKLGDEDFETLKKHITKLCFWEQANLGIDSNHWHFDPREFIRHFRKCGWLSARDLALCVPRYPTYTQTGTVRTAVSVGPGSISYANAIARTRTHLLPLNQMMRKYGLSASRLRQSHFLAQIMLETDKWQALYEYGHGAANAALPMTQYYSAFYGRGIMQLTWAGNYESYGTYRAFPNNTEGYADHRITATSNHYWGDPTTRDAHGHITGLDASKPARRWATRYDPDLIYQVPYNACDSGGHYWVSKHHSGHIDINRVADGGFTPEAIGRVSVLVNGGGNGYFERQAYAQYAFGRLGDAVTVGIVVRFHTARNNVQIDVNFSMPI